MKGIYKMKYLLIILITSICCIKCDKEKVPTIVVVKQDETYSPDKIRPVIDEWQQKTFNYFYEGASATTGLALEGNERGEIITTGGGGFGIMALIVGTERGWITREQSANQMRKIVRFLGKAERFKGVWSHWYNPDGTAHPFGDQIQTGDLVETSFLMAGLFTAKEYFTGSSAIEKEIRDSVQSFRNTVNWKFHTKNEDLLYWLWYSRDDKFSLPIGGWNECLITYILALGAPEPHNISASVYQNGWLRNGSAIHKNRKHYGYDLPLGEDFGGPLFFAHYSFLGLNPLYLEDNIVNYWNQNTAHTLINRHYCLYEAPSANKYSEADWGLSACYGGKPPWNYSARSPLNDDGVITPTASLSSFPYTPFYSTQMLLRLVETSLMHGTYGFADSYAPATSTSEKRHLAIDQGPIVVMIENYRTGLIWNLLMRNEDVQKGLGLAGMKEYPDFQEGFLKTFVNSKTQEYDMMRHPDRLKYELDYYVNESGNTRFQFSNSSGQITLDSVVVANKGENVFDFPNSSKIISGKQYTVKMKTSENKEYTLKVRMR